MKRFPLFAFTFFLLLLSQQCMGQQELPQELYKKWIHSYEEDSAGYLVYRPASYDFPPSRGRRGFEILPEKGFILYKIAPADGYQKVKGRWTSPEKNHLQVELAGKGAENFTIQIIEYSADRLVVKKE
ncbi:hypothetical protein [Nafulsella turpanensis]|uniref:hypothetical protein n=1 Tax=Nafulsella turpanensis TaxID=1265690 RepID=UPI0012693204|nr:hypothetical protein [Nafulsella turpanensis]